jgi:hypothetical protein
MADGLVLICSVHHRAFVSADGTSGFLADSTAGIEFYQAMWVSVPTMSARSPIVSRAVRVVATNRCGPGISPEPGVPNDRSWIG